MKKTFYLIIAVTLSAALFFFTSRYSKTDQLVEDNVEALALGETEIDEACNGCSTTKKHYCCWVFFDELGTGYFFFKD